MKSLQPWFIVWGLVGALAGCTQENPDHGDAAGTEDLSLPAGADLAGDPGDKDLSGDSDKDLASVTTLATACAAYADAYCAKLVSCAAYTVKLLYGDVATCQAGIKAQCLVRGAAPGTGFGAAEFVACAKAESAASCAAFLNDDIHACHPVAGAVADNGRCGLPSQCQSASCQLTTGSCGRCVKAGAVGEGCSFNSPCGYGLSCASGKCAAAGDVGATCGGAPGSTAPCKATLYCNAGKCAAQLKLGDRCNASSTVTECAASQGLFCDQTTSRCVARTLASAGEACGYSVGKQCAASGTCAGAMGGRKCLAAGQLGEMCNTASGLGCISPGTCSSGTCAVFDPASCK